MRCYRCGAELSLTQRRCPSCGAVQPAAAVPPGMVRRPTMRGAAAHARSAVRKPGNSRVLWLVLGGLVLAFTCLLVLAVVLVVAFTDLPARLFGGSYQATIGTAGGMLEGPDGVQLVVPAGAFEADAEIHIEVNDSPPPPPPGMQPVSPAYHITVPEDLVIGIPIEVVIPFEPAAGSAAYRYMAYQWDGAQWNALSGYADGNVFHTQSRDFSNIQIQQEACDYGNYGVVEMVHPISEPKTSVHTWVYALVGEDVCPGAASPRWSWNSWETPFGSYPCNTYPCEYARFNLPWGDYTTWCIDWSPGDVNGDNWKDYFHFFLTAPVFITGAPPTCRLSEYLTEDCIPQRVDYVLPAWQAAIPGLCGMNGPGAIPASSLPNPAQLSATLTAQAATISAANTLFPTTPAQITPTGNPPAATSLPGSATPAGLDIRPFIVDSNHIDNYHYDFSMVGLAHNEDYVTLKGPITVDYIFKHCVEINCTSTSTVIEDPPVRVVIAAGETHQFYLEDTVGAHAGQDWNLFIQIISIDE